MRGTKRKRDTCTVNSWVVTSEESHSNPHEVVIGRSEATGIVHGHTGLTGEGSNQLRSDQVTPISSYISEGPTRWLGLRHGPTAQLDGTGLRPIQTQTDHSSPAVRQVEGPVRLGGGHAQHGNLGTVPLSLASEASNWLEARNPLTRRTERTGPAPLAGLNDSATPTGEIAIGERELTPEDFWSLLRDASYEVW